MATATSSEAESSEKQGEKVDRIKQTLADLDALLGIEETVEEVEETPKVRIGHCRPLYGVFCPFRLGAWPPFLPCSL